MAAVANANGLTDYREPLPRHSWDPRAVSDPLLIADEIPGSVPARRLPPVPLVMETPVAVVSGSWGVAKRHRSGSSLGRAVLASPRPALQQANATA